MKTPEQLAFGQEVTELLERMDERQIRRAARFMELVSSMASSHFSVLVSTVL